MVRTWAPDDFWQAAQPLIPVPPPRRQGGGKRRADDRAVLAAIVYLVQAGCSWWKLPAGLFGVSQATAHRRFTEGPEPGFGAAAPAVPAPPRGARRDRLVPGGGGLHRGPGRKRGDHTGPNPVDRGKLGSKIHVLCDRRGLPLTVLTSAANPPTARSCCCPCWTRSPRSAHQPAARLPGRPSCTPTRPMTSPRSAPNCAGGVSACGSPRAWSPPTGWAAIAGSSRPACPGYRATAAWSAATNARPNTSKPSPTSPAPCSATDA